MTNINYSHSPGITVDHLSVSSYTAASMLSSCPLHYFTHYPLYPLGCCLQYGYSALMKASENNDLKMVQALLAAGADVNAKDIYVGAKSSRGAIIKGSLLIGGGDVG